MKKSDFKKYAIRYFTPNEIEDTGACLKDVKPELIIKLDRWRTYLETPVKLIFNGITTGEHSSKKHKSGEAVDCYPLGGQPDGFSFWYHQAYKAGFSGIGMYYNKETNLVTFHLDLGAYRSWLGTKRNKHEVWKYSSLIKNPTEEGF